MLTLCDHNHEPITFYKAIGGRCPLCAAEDYETVELKDTKQDLEEAHEQSAHYQESLIDAIDLLNANNIKHDISL